MLDGKKLKNLQSEGETLNITKYLMNEAGLIQAVDQVRINLSCVIWAEHFPMNHMCNPGSMIPEYYTQPFQRIRVCYPFSNFKVEDMIIREDSLLYTYITKMDTEGQNFFEAKFVNDTISEHMSVIW